MIVFYNAAKQIQIALRIIEIVLIAPSHWTDFDPNVTETQQKRSTLSPTRRANATAHGAVTNTSSFLSFIDSTNNSSENAENKPRRAMYKLTSNQLYFHVKQKRNRSKRKGFKPNDDYLKQNDILSLEPAAFTRRQHPSTYSSRLVDDFIALSLVPEPSLESIRNR